jgi:predicted RecA/RadA family phage recombinase
VYSYTSFCEGDTRKLTAPADNSISTNMVIDDIVWFGKSTATAGSAAFQGVSKLANDKVQIGFRIYWSDKTGTTTTSKYRQGLGYITNLAPTVNPEAPVWVTPLEIAVDGGYSDGVGAI